ncbi:MAG: BatA domain-containing protein, partial [Planctomycetes bacterium]|nr:BatA domain-containing protein [Planctomycetota bacterium]
MAFLNSYFLIALAAVAVPILIHLLTRDRVRKVAFSTLQFFQKISKKVLRRKKFREMLLLVMRAAACGLLALAFARPILRSDAADAVGMVKAGTARVIVVDQSASMRRPGLSEAAAKEAAAALSSLAEGADAAALVTFADAPRLDVPLGRDFGDLRTGLASLVPGHGGTDMA